MPANRRIAAGLEHSDIGRSKPHFLRPNPFAGDTGELDPRLAEAKRAGLPQLIDVLEGARVFVAVNAHAHPGFEDDGTLKTHTKTSLTELEQACQATEGKHGQARVLPIFSHASLVAKHDPRARPVPALGSQAAKTALASGLDALLLDPGPGEILVGTSVLLAWAAGRTWCDPVADERVRAAIDAALAAARASHPGCLGDAEITSPTGGGVGLKVAVGGPWARPAVEALASTLREDERIARLAGTVEIAVRAAVVEKY